MPYEEGGKQRYMNLWLSWTQDKTRLYRKLTAKDIAELREWVAGLKEGDYVNAKEVDSKFEGQKQFQVSGKIAGAQKASAAGVGPNDDIPF